MERKEIKPAWMGQADSQIARKRRTRTSGTDLVLYITAGIILASIVIGVANHLYSIYQSRKAIDAFNASMEQLEREMKQQALEWELEARRALQPSAVRIPTRDRYQERQDQIRRQHCDFWIAQKDSSRRTEKLREYCR